MLQSTNGGVLFNLSTPAFGLSGWAPMHEKLFLLTSKQVARRLTGVFDFVWPTAAAIWNLRWQVAGFVSVAPHATGSDLAGRFVDGSGIRGANLRRACIDSSWEDQQQEFARFLLFEFCALYEAWCEGSAEELALPAAVSKQLQFPTTIKNGTPTSGVGHALNSIGRVGSTPLAGAISPVISTNKKNSPQHLEQLLVCYRYFKEVRNSLVHNGGHASARFADAERAYRHLTPSDLGVKEVPAFSLQTPGSRATLNLRGVVGFGDIVLRLVSTLDAELTQSAGAEKSFLRRWTTVHGRNPILVPVARAPRIDRIKRLVRKLDLPSPSVTPPFDAWLQEHRCIV